MNLKIVLFALCILFLSSANHAKAQEGYGSNPTKRIEAELDRKSDEAIYCNYDNVRAYFEAAYEQNISIPRGVLEAVAFQYNRFKSQAKDNDDCDHGMPQAHTIMGLFSNGKGVFRENLRLVSELSEYPMMEILDSDSIAVLAYAKAFHKLQSQYNCFSDSVELYKVILFELSELPTQEDQFNDYATNSFLYVIYHFLSRRDCERFNIPKRTIDFERIFGKNLKMLKAEKITIHDNTRDASTVTNSDYPGANFVAAASCNYSAGRNGTAISSVTIHYTQGSYAGTIAWFQNCASSVSAHYIIRSIDGQVTQMVKESDKAWHVGSANSYTIGIEHEAMGDIASYFTSSMYQSSAALVRNICSRNSLNTHRVFYRDTLDNGVALNHGVHSLGGATACTQIRGHQHYPNQTHTDPGRHWNWNLYYKLINQNPQKSVFTADSGTFTDSGGENGDYANDERSLYLIKVDGADSIALTFGEFSLETDYDFIWIYDGDNEFAPLIGRWNTQSPGRVVSNGGNILVEFRSDCATTAPGWKAHWQAYYADSAGDSVWEEQNDVLADDNDEPANDNSSPSTYINIPDNSWITRNFTATFNDQDDIGVKWRFYQIMESTGTYWYANFLRGFICDNFDLQLNTNLWVNNTLHPWKVINGELRQTNDTASCATIAAAINGVSHSAYLYDFYLKFNTSGKFSFYFNCNNAPSITPCFSGYELEIDQAGKTIRLYRLIMGAKRLIMKKENITTLIGTSYLYRVVFDVGSGEILLKRHGNKIFKVTDGQVMATQYSYIGFASKQSSIAIDNLRVYGSRASEIPVSVGPADTNMIHRQAVNGLSRTKMKSVVVDKAYNFSTLVEKQLKVDYTAPSSPGNLSVWEVDVLQEDGTTATYISANWDQSHDENSGISKYLYSKINSPLYNSIWNDNGMMLSCSNCYVATNNVDFNVVAENKAGLRSRPTSVSYVRVRPEPQKKIEMKYATIKLSNNKVFIRLNEDSGQQCLQNRYTLYDIAGKCLQNGLFEKETSIETDGFAKGIYVVTVTGKNGGYVAEKIVIM